ncbi:MAG: hypothetical protein AVDCRST_MAG91-1270 [uncultured Sphingomonadaceae bacterium]|uniref:DUF417 family protein n=1 Tax=uncultured Sphingomonadaceae bacterium TaxID=169976 RepID=A0A6J4STW6_9SPHN|nr:MAG: hypothetical protein AVDCRST_MAG91-1270 [uncultured Sphingomonadaceae bacterium]
MAERTSSRFRPAARTVVPTRSSAMHIVRYSLVLIFLAFGYVKFFPFEAKGIAAFINAHPLLSWLTRAFGEAGASAFLGVIEIATGLLLALGRWSPRLSALGGVMGMFTFFTTVSLFFFLPDVFEASAGGFPAISGTGGFLLKDAVLFAACLACVVDSLDSVKQAPATLSA